MAEGGTRSDDGPPRKRQWKGNYTVVITPTETWTHDFCLLSSKEDDKTPTLTELMELRDCGLGKHKVVFQGKNSDHGKVREVLETTYPKLKTQNGAFELLRAQRGGVSQLLQVIPLSGKGYSIGHLKEDVNSNTIIYIRPKQGDLSISKADIPANSNITSECQHCHQKISLSGLRAHLQICQRINADDQDQ